jgi:hypothetical protein
MKIYHTVILLFLFLLTPFQCASNPTHMNHYHSELTAEQQAEQRLNRHIESIALLRDASIARLPEIDLAGYFAFSVMPRATGRAGEVTYMVNEQEILSSGQPDHFDRIMKIVMEDENKPPLDVTAFARLFLRMKAIRSGVLLDRPDGHILIQPNQLPSEMFEPPSIRDTPEGVNYRFWLFDTDRYVPVFWDIWVKRDGTTTFSSREINK